MTEFIFMLTHDDSTLPDALEVYGTLRGIEGLRYVGFKDVGATFDRLLALTDAIHADGRTAMLEVVSEDPSAELRSIEAARRLGVDWVLGGTHADEALPLLTGSGLRYCPFPGQVIGHPSLLRGTVESIAADASALTARPGVYGLDLLAWIRRGRAGTGSVRSWRHPAGRSSPRGVSTPPSASGRSSRLACGATPSAAPSSRAGCPGGPRSLTRSGRSSPSRQPLMRPSVPRPVEPQAVARPDPDTSSLRGDPKELPNEHERLRSSCPGFDPAGSPRIRAHTLQYRASRYLRVSDPACQPRCQPRRKHWWTR